MLTVVTPAAHLRLVPLAVVKDEIGVTDSGQDAKLLRKIAVASQAVAQAWGNPLARQQYAETFAGSDQPEIRLSLNPVESLSAVTWMGEGVPLASLYDAERGSLWLAAGWQRSSLVSQGLTSSDDPGALDYMATFWAGFLLPEDVTDWSASVAYSAGRWARPVASSSALRFRAEGSGTSGSFEPAWPLEIGDSVLDGSVAWKAYGARELPADLSEACLYETLEAVRSPVRDRAIRSYRTEGALIDYVLHPIVSGGVLGALRNPDAERILQSYGRRW